MTQMTATTTTTAAAKVVNKNAQMIKMDIVRQQMFLTVVVIVLFLSFQGNQPLARLSFGASPCFSTSATIKRIIVLSKISGLAAGVKEKLSTANFPIINVEHSHVKRGKNVKHNFLTLHFNIQKYYF